MQGGWAMRRFAALAVLVFVVTGCGPGLSTMKVSTTAPRHYNGFSVVPPGVGDWAVLSLNDRHVEFESKVGSGVTRGLVVNRYNLGRPVKTPDEFLKYVEDVYFVPGTGVEFVSHEAHLEPKYGPYCVGYSYKYKEYGNNMAFRFQKGRGYACLHPQALDKEFKIVYAEIYPPGEEKEYQDNVTSAFFDGFRFTDYRK
jgi:hypothetical protein